MADFHMTTYDPNAYLSLCSTIERLGLEDRIEVIKGDIVETLPSYFSSRPGARVSMLHCDLDVFEPTLETLKSVWPRLVPGGIAIFDEYAVDEWGESDAVDEFFQSQNIEIQLQASAFSRTPTAYCIKSRFS
jgi:predicted O-methyltransferase YrrM